MRPRTSLSLLAVAMASVAAPFLSAADGDAKLSGAPSQEYLDQVKELQGFVTSRDLDLYEMSCVPLVLDDIVIRDRTGREQAYTYLTFRIRNQVSSAGKLTDQMPRYAEILKTIADQYAGVVKVSTDGGGKVTVGDSGNPDTVILERREQEPKERSISLSVTAFDELGSRIQLLDEPVGSGKQNEFPVDDRGNRRQDAHFDRVRERIEELASRRLHSIHEISWVKDESGKLQERKIKPYDPAIRDAEGVSQGELFGVAIFQRFNLRGSAFTIEMRGLCNKLRMMVPPVEEGKPENYLSTRILRRTLVMQYHRSGDEFYRELDRYRMRSCSYQWIDTFQRLDKRRTAAMSKYYIEGIQGDKYRADLGDAFWSWYDQTRTANPGAGDKLPDLKATMKAGAGP